MMKPLDYVVLISVLPLIPLMATLERWLAKTVPMFIFSLYLLYCAFVAWYFNMGRSTTVATALVGLLGCGVAMFKHIAHLQQKNG
jgi:hypothetical protein